MNQSETETPLQPKARPQSLAFRSGMMALGLIIGGLLGWLYVAEWDKQYLGRVRLEVIDGSRVMDGPKNSAELPPSQSCLPTSNDVLLSVVRSESLAARWGLGTDESAAQSKLARMVDSPPPAENGIEVVDVTSNNPLEAAELAEAVAQSYKLRLRERNELMAEQQEQILQDKITKQVDLVGEKRLRLLKLAKWTEIKDVGPLNPTIGSPPDREQQASTTLLQLREELMKIRSSLAYDQADLPHVDTLKSGYFVDLPIGIKLPESVAKSYPEYQKLLVNLAILKSHGLGSRHPRVIASRKQLAQQRNLLNDGLDAWKISLTSRILLGEEKQRNLELRVQEAMTGRHFEATDNLEYEKAKQEYEEELARSYELHRVVRGKLENRLPGPLVIFHEHAHASTEPLIGRAFFTVPLGALAGAVLGLTASFALESIFRGRKRTAEAAT